MPATPLRHYYCQDADACHAMIRADASPLRYYAIMPLRRDITLITLLFTPCYCLDATLLLLRHAAACFTPLPFAYAAVIFATIDIAMPIRCAAFADADITLILR